MKWVALLVVLAAVAPFLSWLRQNPGKRPIVWTVFGFLAVQQAPLDLYIGLISWGGWPGHTKGMELALLDVFAFILLLSLPRRKARFPFWPGILFYMTAVAIAAAQAPNAQPAFFYLWQLTRIFFIAFVVTKAVAADNRVAFWLVNGTGLGLLLAVGIAVWDRFVGGDFQAGGSFGHQNMLGLMSHFVTFPLLALLLGGARGRIPILAPLAGVLVPIVTVSRAALGFTGGGYLVLFLLSLRRGWSARKGRVAMIGLLAILAASPLAVSSFETRLSRDASKEPVSEGEDERARFEKAASLMLAEHSFGVGPNHYVLIANINGYSSRAGVVPTHGSRSAHVHNIYWLVAAETGYLGIISFSFLLMQPLLRAFRAAGRYRKDLRGDLLLGSGMALLTVYIHSKFEWLLTTFVVQYMFAVALGIIAGLSAEMLNKRSGADRDQPPLAN